MTTNRPATIATIFDVVSSVLTSDVGCHLTLLQASNAVDIALRTVIGLYCLGGNTLDIDLGNGHFLHCSLKPAPKWVRS